MTDDNEVYEPTSKNILEVAFDQMRAEISAELSDGLDLIRNEVAEAIHKHLGTSEDVDRRLTRVITALEYKLDEEIRTVNDYISQVDQGILISELEDTVNSLEIHVREDVVQICQEVLSETDFEVVVSP